MSELAVTPPYPVRFEVDYPERQSRWKALFRIFLALPVLLFLAIIAGGGGFADTTPDPDAARSGGITIGAASSVVLAIWITILLRRNIPRWLFDFIVALQRFVLRAGAYVFLLTDEYPAFEGDYPVRYEVDYPERPSRWRLVIWKFITSIPHFIILIVLGIAMLVVVMIAWFAILITGRYPRGLHNFVSGVMRWSTRVNAYFYSLTDEYPPFTLEDRAGPAGRDSYMISSVVGVLLTVVLAGGITAAVVLIGPNEERVSVPYEDLITGQDIPTQVIINDILITLPGGSDQLFSPYDELFFPKEDHRLVVFTRIVENYREQDIDFEERDLRLKDTDGDWHDPFLFLVGGRTDELTLEEGDGAPALIFFELPEDQDPAELHFDVPYSFRDLVYDFQP